MSRTFVFLALFAGALLVFPASAVADEVDDEREIAEATSEQLRLNEQGVEALIKDNPARAVALLDDAYRLGPINILALNLGRAYHALGRCDDAREKLDAVFTLPVVKQPPAHRVDDRAREYLQDLEESCEDDEETELASPDADEQPSIDDDDTASVDDTDSVEEIDAVDMTEQQQWGLYTIGTGAAVAATGLGLHLGARSQRSSARQRIESEDSFDGDVNTEITQAEVQQIESRANTLDTIGLGAGIVGAVTIGVGTYLYLSAPEPAAQSSSLDISLGKDAWSISWTTRF